MERLPNITTSNMTLVGTMSREPQSILGSPRDCPESPIKPLVKEYT